MLKRTFIALTICTLLLWNTWPIQAVSFAAEAYRLQVGYYENMKIAQTMKAKVEKLGKPAYLVTTPAKRYMVYSGDFTTKVEAQTAATFLKKKGIPSFLKTTQAKTAPITDKVKVIAKPENPVAPSAPKPELTAVPNVTKVKNIKFNSDILRQGVFGNYTQFLEINKNWNLSNDPYLELVYSHSDIKDYRKSSLTVYLNDIPVDTFLLDTKANHNLHQRIYLPKDKLKTDFNNIRLGVYNRISDEPCSDDANPGNWIVFHAESFIHLEYKLKADSEGLANYPYPYLIKDSEYAINAVLTVPDHPTESELATALMLAADLGKREKFSDLVPSLKTWSQLTPDDQKQNLIFIGQDDRLPNLVKSNLEKNMAYTEGIIAESASPFQPTSNLLIITAKPTTDLRNALRLLSSDEKLFQMNGNYQLFNQTDGPDALAIKPSSTMTLQNLGYSDLDFRGRFQQQASFPINVPKDQYIGPASNVVLKFHYSKVLDFEKSSVVFSINGTPIADKKLGELSADNDTMIVAIPDQYRKLTSLNMTVTFNLLDVKYDCTSSFDQHLWAVLSKDSYLDFKYNELKKGFFDNYPSPLIQHGRFSDSAVIIPDEPSKSLLLVLSQAFAHMGHAMDYINNIDVVYAKNFNDRIKGKNLMVFGTYEDNKVIQSLNNYMNLPYENPKALKVDGKLHILSPFNTQSMVAQIFENPWATGASVFVFTSPNESQLIHLSRFLGTFEFSNRLKGDTVLINEFGIEKTFYLTAIIEAQPANKKDVLGNVVSTVGRLNNKSLYPFYIFGFIALLAVFTSIYFTIRRNRNTR